MQKGKRGTAWGTALAMFAMALSGCDASPAAQQPTSDARTVVRAAEVRLAPQEERYRYPGVVRARERAAPAFLSAGTLAERYVERGQQVERGEPLALLHNPALAPALAATEGQVKELDARIAQLRRDLERARALRQRELVAAAEVDRYEAEIEALLQSREQAVARRSDAREQVNEMTLRAPFEGEVTDLLVEPGDFVNAGQSILQLSGVEELEIQLRVPASLENRLVTGMPVSVSPTLRPSRVEGRIASVGRAGAGLAPVIIRLDEGSDLSPGEPVRVHLEVPGSDALQVPLSAVVDPGGHAPRVLVLIDEAQGSGDVVHSVPVIPGRLGEEWVSVSASLAPGDRVVTAGHGRLAEGERVRVLP